MMISEKAKNFLFYLVDKYNSDGRRSFDNMDYISIRDSERFIAELSDDGLLDVPNSIDGTIILTQEAINYKF